MRATVPASTFLVAFVVLLAGVVPAAAQTTPVLNPRIVEFDPSPDHSALDAQSQPIVQRYQLLFYRLGETQPALTSDLGKPALETDGKIRVDFSTRTSPWPPPNGDYQARVAAVGPTGAGQSDSSNPFSFSFQDCSASLGALEQAFGEVGGTGSVQVNTASGCSWTASSAESWVTLSKSAGSGAGPVGFSVARNPDRVTRTATLTIAGHAFKVTQAAASCLFTLSPSSAILGGNGGVGTVILTTMIGCTWNAASGASWATISSASGAGSANIGYTVEKNKTGTARTATITVAGQAFVVTQGTSAVPSQPKKPRVSINDK